MKHVRPYISQSFLNYWCIFCASFLLVGCSYFDTSGHGELQTEKPVMDERVYAAQDFDLKQVIAANTGGSVEIYGFDESVPAAQPIETFGTDAGAVEVQPARAVPVMPASAPVSMHSSDPSVQIFSLDDGVPLMPAGFEPITPVRQPAREEEYVSVANAAGDKVIVYFSHDSAVLNNDALNKLEGLASNFNANAGQGLTVEGHASIRANYNDAAQKRIVNLKVSMDRALAVAGDLIRRGVPTEAMRVVGWGDTRPPRDLNGKSEEEAARRVEISR